MRRTWTIVGVQDVAASFRWYQSLFGNPETSPSHDHFGQILDADGTVLLCLHQWGAHDHPSLTSPDNGTPGNGLLLFFRVEDYDQTLTRARALVARLDEEPHVNPNTQTPEFSLRDPDGYFVTISAHSQTSFAARPIGYVRSPLRELAEAPKQGTEGGVEAWIDVLPEYAPALEGLRPGAQLVVVTWLHAARRDLLQVHPRDDYSLPLAGVFRTRSADRPNPIGLHPVTIREIDRLRLRIGPLEVIDGTPVLDLKPVI